MQYYVYSIIAEAASAAEPNTKKLKKSSDATRTLQQEISKEHIGMHKNSIQLSVSSNASV